MPMKVILYLILITLAICTPASMFELNKKHELILTLPISSGRLLKLSAFIQSEKVQQVTIQGSTEYTANAILMYIRQVKLQSLVIDVPCSVSILSGFIENNEVDSLEFLIDFELLDETFESVPDCDSVVYGYSFEELRVKEFRVKKELKVKVVRPNAYNLIGLRNLAVGWGVTHLHIDGIDFRSASKIINFIKDIMDTDSRIISFTLNQTLFGDDFHEAVKYFKNLKHLNLSRNNFTPKVFQAISDLTDLISFDASYQDYSAYELNIKSAHRAIERILRNNNKLKQVNLAGLAIQSIGDVIPDMPFLARIDLSNNFIAKLSYNDLAAAMSLREINLKSNDLDDFQVFEITYFLSQSHNCIIVYLYGNSGISDRTATMSSDMIFFSGSAIRFTK